MEERNRIYYKSDFDFIINIGGLANNVDGAVDLDFEGVVFSELRGSKGFRFSRVGNVWINCVKADQGASHRCAKGMAVRVTCDSHSLPPGPLSLELTVHFPDNAYPDGCRKQVCRHPLPIELVTGECDCNTVSPSSIAVTLPYVWASAYELANENGYKGTREEYNTALSDLPSVVDTAHIVESMLTDVAHGKAELADTLRRAGQDVADDAPLPVMAQAVRSLNLTPEDAPQGSAVTFADFGMAAPVNLLDMLHTHQKAGYLASFGILFNSRTITLAGADAYLTSDGQFSEKPGRVEFERSLSNWAIYYFKEETFSLPDLTAATSEYLEIIFYKGLPNIGTTPDIQTCVFLAKGINVNLSNVKFKHLIGNGECSILAYAANTFTRRAIIYGDNINITFQASNCTSFEMPDCIHLTGSVVTVSSLTRFYVPKVKTATAFTFPNMRDFKGCLSMPSLEEMTVNNDYGNGITNTPMTEVYMPRLRRTIPLIWTGYGHTNGYTFGNVPSLIKLELPMLEEFAGFIITSGASLLELSLPSIKKIHNGKNWISNVPKLATVNLGAQQEGRVEFPSLPSVTTITVQPGYRQTLNIASLTNLTAECLTQLIMNLGDNNDRDTVTITLGSANLAKLSDDDIAAAQAKNFTLA